jgi:hypothetical protein
VQIKDPNLHLKLQEMCDCYLDTGFAEQLAWMATGPSEDQEEDAVKYLALAIMYGITEKARSLKLKRGEDGTIKASLKAEEKVTLPAPSPAIFDRINDIVRRILHFEEGGGESPLALGLRTGSIDLEVKLKDKGGKSSLKISFPAW